MGKITDLNVTGLNPAKHAALLGDAHEMIVVGLLARLGFEVGMIAAKGGPYDLWVIAFKDNTTRQIQPLRVQIKTISSGGSIGFTGGQRGGVDRIYLSDVKVYKYTEKDNDLIIGVKPDTLDLYLVPTKFISKWGKSRSVNKLQPLKNNWDILLNWNGQFLKTLESQLPA
jgi:hypothetical protein